MSPEFLNRVPHSNGPRLQDFGIDATETELLADGGVHEAHCSRTEARGKIPAAEMGESRDRDDRRTDGEPGSRGHVLRAEIQVDIQLISRQRPARSVLAEQGNHANVHNVEL